MLKNSRELVGVHPCPFGTSGLVQKWPPFEKFLQKSQIEIRESHPGAHDIMIRKHMRLFKEKVDHTRVWGNVLGDNENI